MNKSIELAKRIYNYTEPWNREQTIEEIAEDITGEGAMSIIEYLLDVLDMATVDEDKAVTRKEFLRLYNEELNKHFEEMDKAENEDEYENLTAHIYGYPITVHWNGIYCSCDDGATPYNHIIPGIEVCDEELDDEE